MLLSIYKSNSLVAAQELALPVTNDAGVLARLVPIGPWILSHDSLISEISSWRQRSMKMYLHQFVATPENTQKYLKHQSIGEPNRLLFLVQHNFNFIGHLGIANAADDSAELDNLMRGKRGGPRDLMLLCEAALVDWCMTHLRLRRIYLRVLSTNVLAKEIHKQLGFSLIRQASVFRQVEGDRVQLRECVPEHANVGYTIDYMELQA